MSERQPPNPNPEPPREPDAALDQYLDGLMSEAEASEFEARLASDPALHAAVETQRAIDRSLLAFGRHDANHLEACLAGLKDHDDASTDGDGPLPMHSLPAPTHAGAPARPWWLRVGAIAAAVALAGVAAWMWLGGWASSPPTSYPDPQTVVIAEVYELALANGFEPEWVCETDQEFRDTFRDRLGQAVSLRPLPDDRVALGLSYLPRARESTVYLLAEAEGQPVLVFFDRTFLLRYYELDPPDGLFLHRGRAGGLDVLELSPLPEPKFLDFLVPVEPSGDE
ncbi:MAG: hypothetical protein AAF663_01660 [Planctomycetota bacterium]